MGAVDQFQAARERVVAEYERKLSRIDRCQDAHWKALEITEAWEAGLAGRSARVYLGEGHVMVYLGLAPSEIFASAEEAFCQAQTDLRAAFPAHWKGDWSEVRDDSTQTEARRASLLTVSEGPGHWYDNGVLVSLTVGADVGAGTACQVIEVGRRTITDRVDTKREVPIFKAICPSDPVGGSASEAA